MKVFLSELLSKLIKLIVTIFTFFCLMLIVLMFTYFPTTKDLSTLFVVTYIVVVVLLCVVDYTIIDVLYIKESYKKKCSLCYHSSPASAKFCSECGTALEGTEIDAGVDTQEELDQNAIAKGEETVEDTSARVCPQCNLLILDANDYCGSCGAYLSTPITQTQVKNYLN